MRHGVPQIEMNDDLNFSTMAHNDKQISQQVLTIVFKFQMPRWKCYQ